MVTVSSRAAAAVAIDLRVQMHTLQEGSRPAAVSNGTLGELRAIPHNRAMQSRPPPDDTGAAA